jgi:hypothetical protein
MPARCLWNVCKTGAHVEGRRLTPRGPFRLLYGHVSGVTGRAGGGVEPETVELASTAATTIVALLATNAWGLPE